VHILVLILSVMIFSALQLLLCVKTKLLCKILPALLGVITALFVVMSMITDNWESFGYILLSIYFAFLLIACGIVFLILKLIKNKHTKE